MHRKNLADISHKLSIIYKHIQSMYNELRYQAKRHTIAKRLWKEKKKKKILHHLPQFFFFFVVVGENNKAEKQQGHSYGKGNNI